MRAEAEFIGAIQEMLKPAAEENKPFDEKYKARDTLNELLSDIKSWWEEAETVRAFKGMVLHRLGTNYYETDEITMGEKTMQESAAVWKSVSKELQLNFANCI